MQAPLEARTASDAAQADTARTIAEQPVLADRRPEAVAQRKLDEAINNSPRVLQQRALSDAVHNRHRAVAQREEKTNNTGLPNQLKSGIESLSGMSMDHVKVHYNSDKPAQMQAHAYAQGSEIHLGAGQERHLPHEAWHVVQQAQGRVRPTLQMKAGAVNDDPSLEKEADVMGEQAARFEGDHDARNLVAEERVAGVAAQRVAGVVQKAVAPFKTPAAPNAEELLIIADANAIDALTDAAYLNTMARLAASIAPIPTALTIAHFPGVTEGHFAYMCEALQGQNNSLKAAAVGYVIEDQVTHGGGRPAAALPQYGVGNAIPDFVISHGADGAVRRGIVDITTTNQLGHVLEKDFHIGPYSLVWESVYPSIDFTALGAGAVALAPATAALIAESKRVRANSFITEKMYRINRSLGLLYEGVMQNDGVFRREGEALSAFLNGLPRNAGWTAGQVAMANTHIGNVNNLLTIDHRLETLDQIIINAQNRYLVAGAPMW